LGVQLLGWIIIITIFLAWNKLCGNLFKGLRVEMQPSFELTCMSLVAIDNLDFTGHDIKAKSMIHLNKKRLRQFMQTDRKTNN